VGGFENKFEIKNTNVICLSPLALNYRRQENKKKMYNRRNFLKLTSAAAFGGLMLGGNINIFGQQQERFPIPQTILSDKTLTLTKQNFEPLLDTIFVFSNENGSAVSMKLVEVDGRENMKDKSSQIPTDGFTLIFEMQGKVAPGDNIYRVSHSALGDFPMFVSTVDRTGRHYQAVFNRVYF
jgi:hypothetical protein